MGAMNKFLRVLTVTGLALSLTSCANMRGESELSAYGAFLAARYAGVNRDAQGAADYYAEALHRAPGDAVLTDRAFITALLAGEMDRASELAIAAYNAGDDSRLAGLYYATDLIASRRYGPAVDLLENTRGYGPFNAYLAETSLHWAMLGNGNIDAALAAAQEASGPGELAPFMTFHRALLFDAAGRVEEAESAYRASLFAYPFARMATEEFGRFLEQNNQVDAAATLYRSYLDNTPGEASIEQALRRADEGARLPRQLTVSQYAARSSFGPAARLAANADMDLTVLYLRIVQQLDPDYAPVRTLLAGSLERIGLPAAALAEYRAVREGPFRLAADVDEIWLTARLNRLEQATIMARDLVARTGDAQARLILSDLLRVQAQCAEAVETYAGVIAESVAADIAVDWRYYFFKATCLDELGRWDEAEIDLLEALRVAPDEPQVLNHLGYTWVDRGEHLDRAFEMIERAAELEPDSGYIIDSLGWAHYRLGNYDDAVVYLESATALNPGSTTANFHLGDAYWQVGRVLEAGFQWQRALDLEPTTEQSDQLRDRIARGMPTGVTEIAVNDVSEESPNDQ
jgi:tetratricopeptide (TPR) repeat protein